MVESDCISEQMTVYNEGLPPSRTSGVSERLKIKKAGYSSSESDQVRNRARQQSPAAALCAGKREY